MPSIRRTFVLFLISHLAVLFIPILMGLVLYTEAVRSARASADRYAQTLLAEIGEQADKALIEVRSYAIQTAGSRDVKRMAGAGGELTPEQRYLASQIVESLTSADTPALVRMILLYYPASDMVLTSGSALSRPLFDRYTAFFTGVRYAALDAEAHGVGGFVVDGNEGEPVAAYALRFPIGRAQENSPVCALIIDSAAVTRMMNRIEAVSGSASFIVDGEGRVLFSGSRAPPIRHFPGFGDEHLTVDGVAYRLQRRGAVGGLSYVALTDEAAITRDVRRLRNVTVAVLCACLAIGAGAAYILSRRSYAPIDRLVRLVSERTSSHPGGRSDTEYLYRQIQEVFTQNTQMTRSGMEMVEENARLHALWAAQQGVIRQTLLFRLLKVQDDRPDLLLQALERCGITLPYGYFAVAVFFARESGGAADFAEAFGGALDALDAPPVTQTVRTDVREAALLINYPEEDGYADIRRAFDDLPDPPGRVLKGLSGGQRAIGALPGLLLEAMRAFRASPGGSGALTEEQLGLLRDALRTGDEQALAEALDGVESVLSSAGSEGGRAREQLIRALGEAAREIDPERAEELTAPLRDNERAPTAELVGLAKNTALTLRQAQARGRQSSAERLVERVVDYVQANYTDVNLSVSDIARAIGLSAAYLSTVFKSVKKQNVLDYIYRLRVSKAKYLLVNSYLTVHQVAEAVGFGSDEALTRAFKRYEQTTPGRYRVGKHE